MQVICVDAIGDEFIPKKIYDCKKLGWGFISILSEQNIRYKTSLDGMYWKFKFI